MVAKDVESGGGDELWDRWLKENLSSNKYNYISELRKSANDGEQHA
ncbi:hypothetical protein PP914_gp231 [Arthrobacter phage Qui]|uniref:Uncharacterized protein n=1 Tax=Arthrobacter phage Qui TaxID=2603260 RepID=A0A5B8WI27_9CAUD|nr:hypothetical protein PP914_gp231 [Arthrobacter phage Qui]QED11719.1 hypothetical protein SEA_QUI_231 [Arthrobacter phage Qui]